MEKEENTVTITATPNGPFIVEGRFKLVDREGKAEMKENRTALCRCGRSYKQPFCDVYSSSKRRVSTFSRRALILGIIDLRMRSVIRQSIS